MRGSPRRRGCVGARGGDQGEAFPSQLRNEFVGRAVSRGALHEDALRGLGLYESVLGDTASLKSSVNLFLMLRAGPLEDNVPLVQALEGENLASVEAGLADPVPRAQSFAPLVNSVSVFRQTTELADKAAAALQRAQYRFEADTPAIFLSALWGLASCAAVSCGRLDGRTPYCSLHAGQPKHPLLLQGLCFRGS